MRVVIIHSSTIVKALSNKIFVMLSASSQRLSRQASAPRFILLAVPVHGCLKLSSPARWHALTSWPFSPFCTSLILRSPVSSHHLFSGSLPFRRLPCRFPASCSTPSLHPFFSFSHFLPRQPLLLTPPLSTQKDGSLLTSREIAMAGWKGDRHEWIKDKRRGRGFAGL